MATRKPIKMAKRPSSLLGLCVCALVFVDVCVVVWQLFYVENSTIANTNPLAFTNTSWVGFVSVSVAILTWLGTSLFTLRNSIKQHTITTMLQTRLSATYMGYADKLSSHFMDYDSRLKIDPKLPEKERPTDKVDQAALKYILNYFEFLAIGVVKRDFDESMLRSSLRTMLRKNVQMTRLFIRESQLQNHHLYEHLAWLHDRWLKNQEPALTLTDWDIENHRVTLQGKKREVPCIYCGVVKSKLQAINDETLVSKESA